MNGKIISGPAAVLIIALFFLPWIAVSCDGEIAGEYSGYNLAAGVAPDNAEDIFSGSEINGDPILYVVPLAGLITLILLVITLWKRSFEINAAWGQIIAAFIALLVLFLEWFQLQGQDSNLFEVSIKTAVWGTLACLLAIGMGAVVDLILSRKRPLAAFSSPAKAKQPARAAPRAAPQPFVPPEQDDNHTMLDDGLIGAGEGVDAGATILDDDWLGDANATMLDDALMDGEDEVEQGIYTILGDDLDDFAADMIATSKQIQDVPSTAPLNAEQADSFALPSEKQPVEKTELLHVQPKIVGWLLINPDGRSQEPFRLKANTLIGRAHSNDLVLDDTALSGIHARIFEEDGRFYILDQNSTNGILIFDAIQNEWEKQERYELQDGTQIKLGRTILQFKSGN